MNQCDNLQKDKRKLMSYQQNKKTNGVIKSTVQKTEVVEEVRIIERVLLSVFQRNSKKEKCLAIYNVVPKRSDMYCIWLNKWEKYS